MPNRCPDTALGELRLDDLDLGQDQHLTPRDVLAATPVPFAWYVKTATLLHGTPEEVRRSYEEAVAEGAPAMAADLCARGIPLANLRAFVEVAREHGPAA